jgi:hypothetical protein
MQRTCGVPQSTLGLQARARRSPLRIMGPCAGWVLRRLGRGLQAACRSAAAAASCRGRHGCRACGPAPARPPAAGRRHGGAACPARARGPAAGRSGGPATGSRHRARACRAPCGSAWPGRPGSGRPVGPPRPRRRLDPHRRETRVSSKFGLCRPLRFPYGRIEAAVPVEATIARSVAGTDWRSRPFAGRSPGQAGGDTR